MKTMSGSFSTAKLTTLIVTLIFTSGCSLVPTNDRPQPEMKMEVAVNLYTNTIYMVGALNSDVSVKSVILVSMEGIPAGKYKVIKHEFNGQREGWDLWELMLGEETTLDEKIPVTSNYFTRFTWVADRKALVFDRGVVVPDDTLIKGWGVIHKGGSLKLLHHERGGTGDGTGANYTLEQIKKGWGKKKIDATLIIKPKIIGP